MGQWISRTFGSITLNVWQTGTTGNQTVYNVASWPMNTKVTNANKEQFKSTVNAYLSYIADKDLTHQLYTNYNSGVSTTLSNGNGIEFQSNGLNVVYVTYEFDSNFNDVQYSLSGYLPYRRTDLNVGIQFRCIFSGTNPNSMSVGHMLLKENGTTKSDFDIISSSIAIDDITFHDTSARVDAWDINIPGYSGETIGGSDVKSHINPPMIMCEYLNGDTDRLMISMEEPASSSNYLMPIDGFYCYPSLGIDVTAEEPQEDGYVNELMNRFSPRGFAQNIGMYLIFADGTAADQGSNNIQNYMKDLMYTDITDILDKGFFGSDGKEYILGIRWYYGLNQNLSLFEFERAVRIGTKHLNKFDNIAEFRTTPELSKEFTVWETSELKVMPYFDDGDGNYLDMLSHYQLYLPYYGFMDIDPNDILGGTIKVIYNINIVTGAANIHVICKTARTGNNAVKCYDVNTQIGEDIPYGTDLMEDTLTCFSRVIQSGAKAGMTALSTAGALQASAGETMLTNINNFNQANPGVMQQQGIDVDQVRSDVQGKINRGNIVHSIADKIEQANTPAPIRSSMSGGEGGCLDELYPYLLISRPMARDPQGNREEVLGMPSYAVANLGSVTGFTQIAAVMPNSLTNAPKYINEIIALLQAGVYL